VENGACAAVPGGKNGRVVNLHILSKKILLVGGTPKGKRSMVAKRKKNVRQRGAPKPREARGEGESKSIGPEKSKKSPEVFGELK